MADAGEQPSLGADVTQDTILDGRITLRQPAKGHRAGTDAVLLAAAAPREVSGLVIDVGAGVGTVGLILASRCPEVEIGLVEKDPKIAALARENLMLNGFAPRGRVYEADIFSSRSRVQAGLNPGKAALVLTNPPFADPNRTRASPIAGKKDAHVMPAGGRESLIGWIRACVALLADGGTLLMIHRAEALPDLLAACERRLGGLTLMPVHPQEALPANRILLRGRKGSRAPLSIARPLVLQEQGCFTQAADQIHRGAALIDW